MGAAHGFVQGGDLVVESFAAFVEAAQLGAEAFGGEVGGDMGGVLGAGRGEELLEDVEEAAGVAVGGLDG